ncbi:lysosomal proton-coupled steroid conjugate and bile acid symporter SLC46A3-like [Drosophila nasuta]|uniref:lysosomal proton-coupled steroid conjugate and bile acid symporter SLC46A3-like n=1 Tax=Drosophila nasuta TaxID=42062 RepID=UPI00295EF45D|nr:lysosomal proton-coupled steroid conjugate and bile acid symporter SLC46A3-like [Drosophila nasuta]
MAEPNKFGDVASPQQEEQKLSYLQKLWRFRHYLVVEPILVLYVSVAYWNSIATRNFPLEKACRVNLHFNVPTCIAILDKGNYGIDCDPFEAQLQNVTIQGPTPEELLVDVASPLFNFTVCKAEVQAQKLNADVNGIRSPIGAIFPLIILIFAGGWADKFNKRKPGMIIPIVGEVLQNICQLISAIYFDSIPFEFGSYAEVIVPSLFGSLTLFVMSAYSYMTISTPEEDRVFRFGIFSMVVTGLSFIGLLSGSLLALIGYRNCFILSLVSQILAILYIVFFIKEPKPLTKAKVEPTATAPHPQNQAVDNLAYETTNLDEVPVNKSFQLNPQLAPPRVEPPPVPRRRNLCKELFDPTLLKQLIYFPFAKRENNDRFILLMLILAYFFTVIAPVSEDSYQYLFSLKKLGWNGEDYSVYGSVGGGLAVLGTFIGTTIFSKILKISDSIIGMWSSVFITASHFVFAFSINSWMFYLGNVFDMFASLRVIPIKSIGSTIVADDELSKMFSFFGICEPIAGFIFAPIYSLIYTSTIDSFPGAFFLFSNIFIAPNILVFIVIYIAMRRRPVKDNSMELAQKNGQENSGRDNEITHL